MAGLTYNTLQLFFKFNKRNTFKSVFLLCCVGLFAFTVIRANLHISHKDGIRANLPISQNDEELIVYFRWDKSTEPTSNVRNYVTDHFNTSYKRSFGWKVSNDSLALTPDPTDSGYVLRVFYKKGTRSIYTSNGEICDSRGSPEKKPCCRGAQFIVMPPELYGRGRTFVALEYEVYFDKGFDFASGGKLPGLMGGAMGCAGCIQDRTECFSARLMWRAQGQGEVYAYVPYEQPGGWDLWCEQYIDNNKIYCPKDTCGIEIGKTDTGGFKFIPGQWHKIREEVDVGLPNNYGRITLWVDGVIKVNINKIVLRITDKLGVDGLFFSTFYGGSLPYFGNHGDTYAFFRKFLITNERWPVPTGEYFET